MQLGQCSMLAGIKFVNKKVAAKSLEADRKADRKEKKELKRVRSAFGRQCWQAVSASLSAEAQYARRRRRGSRRPLKEKP